MAEYKLLKTYLVKYLLFRAESWFSVETVHISLAEVFSVVYIVLLN